MEPWIQIPRPPLDEQQTRELEASMRRHPAGKRQDLSRCPSCGQKASGALGESQDMLI